MTDDELIEFWAKEPVRGHQVYLFKRLIDLARKGAAIRVKAVDRIGMPSIDFLRGIFSYDPETGALLWKKRPVEHFFSKHASKVWNTKYSGKPALNSINRHGYKGGRLSNKTFMAHRIIWALVNGEWPVVVDHINGDITDNRIVNLRSVTQLENVRNARLRKDNASGVSGVRWKKRENMWIVSIGTGGAKIHKSFKIKEEAVAFRKAKEVEHGYHPNHGRTAALNHREGE